jgi:ABC-type phosphate transport system substrate-binding protein
LRIIKSLVAVAAVAGTAIALAAPASAEPINGKGKYVTPQAYDIVGGGSDTTQYVIDQISLNYNATVKKHNSAHPYFFSWDAVPPAHPLDTTQNINLKKGCPKELRPNGSSAGITALTTYASVKSGGKTYHCLDFARSSRPRKSTDPSGVGGVEFVIFASDAVTYASATKTNVPNNLKLAQLKEIFGCTVPAAHGFAANTWGALLGKTAKGAGQKIDPIVPQAGSGTLSFWMTTALGLTSTTEPTCGTAKNDTKVSQQPEENEGTWPGFLVKSKGKEVANPNVIYPFSVGSFVAQAYHSRIPGHKRTKSENLFGTDLTGIFHLNGINGVAPTVKVKGGRATNPKWNGTPFHRFLYNVVRYTANTAGHIPGNLEKFFGRKGFLCSKKEHSVLTNYGFEITAACGVSD